MSNKSRLTVVQACVNVYEAAASLGWKVNELECGTVVITSSCTETKHESFIRAWRDQVCKSLYWQRADRKRRDTVETRLDPHDWFTNHLLTSEASDESVAAELGVCKRTVQRHRHRIKSKMATQPIIKHPDAGPPARVSTPQRNGLSIGQHLFRKSDGREFVVDAFPAESDMVSLRCVATRAPWSIRRGDVPVLLNGSKGVAA